MNQTNIAQMYQQACLAELEALKPGNVHIFADGHGMQVQHFITSAEVSAYPMSQPEFSVGQRIYHAVKATIDAVGCNTNLGIILLCAPVIQSYLDNSQIFTKEHLRQTLSDLTCLDAKFVYQAIQLANPAGLGRLEKHDVNEIPTITLLEAMHAAQNYDAIAQQYVNVYEQVFSYGVAEYKEIKMRWESEAWVNTAVYLNFLAHITDTHILRKFGREAALAVQQQAKLHYQAFINQDNPKLYMPALLKFDATLKAKGINPGTSADLTVANILLIKLMQT